jgi:hypothetical protein
MNTKERIFINSKDENYPQSYPFSNLNDLKRKNSNNDKCKQDLIDLIFNPLMWEIDLSANYFMPSNISTSNSNLYVENNASFQKSFGAGLQFGRKIFRKNKFTGYCIKIGVFYDNVKINSTLGQTNYNYFDVDIDQDRYLRKVTLLKINEDINVNMISIPITLTKQFYSFNKWSLKGGIGLNFILPIKSTYNSTADATYAGQYTDLFNITIADNGVYDFGRYTISASDKLKTNNLIIASEFFVEVCYKINTNFNLFCNLKYRKAYQSLFVAKDIQSLSENNSVLESLTNINNITINQFLINGGLSYNF